MLIKRKKIPIKEIILIGFLPSFLKKIIYRFKGYKIGENVSFGIGSVIIGEDVTIGDNSSFGLVSVVRANKIEIGRFVTIGALSMLDTVKIIIGDDSRINENVIVGGIKTPESMLKIGKRVIIMEYSFINPTMPIIIGDDSGIGGHCLLFTHGSWLPQIDGFPVKFAPITLGKKVWLPWRVFIMPGVTIGDEVVIGANSLISKDLPSNVLAAGSPAKIILENYPKTLSCEEQSQIIDSIINDFLEHLTFNGFDVSTEDVKDSKLININKKKVSQVFLDKGDALKSFKSKNNLYINNFDENNRGEFAMVLNLSQRTRIGTSDVGEEFTKFISRYGIRFDRLD